MPNSWRTARSSTKMDRGGPRRKGYLSLKATNERQSARGVSAKKALVNAKSVAFADPASGATSGQYLAELVEKLGISAELKPKTRLVTVNVGEVVQRGEAEVGLQPIPLLMEVQGIDIVGPLPGEVQRLSHFTGAVMSGTQHAAAAQAFLDFLGTALVQAAMRENHFNPAPRSPRRPG